MESHSYLRRLADPHLTARFQRSCGVVPLQEIANGIHPIKREAGTTTFLPNGTVHHATPGAKSVLENGIENGSPGFARGKQVDRTFCGSQLTDDARSRSSQVSTCLEAAEADLQKNHLPHPHNCVKASPAPAPPLGEGEKTGGEDVTYRGQAPRECYTCCNGVALDTDDCRSICADRSHSSAEEASAPDLWPLKREAHPALNGNISAQPSSAADEEQSQSSVANVKTLSKIQSGEEGVERREGPLPPSNTGERYPEGKDPGCSASNAGWRRESAGGDRAKNGYVKNHSLEQNGLRQRREKQVDANANATTCVSSDVSGDASPGYVIKYRALYYLSLVGAFLGDEMFYLMFYPFCTWNLDSILARDTSLIWCVVMYLGQATKDYLRWPRPLSPPVVRLETAHLHEYSMPSTHAMAGTAMPIAMAFQLLSRYQVSPVVVVTGGCCYCALVCFSRLYLGVHSVLDIICGVLFSIIISIVTLPYLQDFDLYQQQHPYAPFIVLLTGLVVCTVCYPSKDVHSAKGDAVQIVACSAGCILAIWFQYQMGISFESDLKPPYAIATPTLEWFLISLVRFISGSAFLAFVYVVVRTASVRFFSYFYGLDKPNTSHPSVRTGYKFVTYLVLGISIMCTVPLLHHALGIARPGQFQEVRW